MMTALFLAVFICVMLFGMVVLFGAPYVPTLKQQTRDAIELANLKPGQLLIELGSGDGRLLRAAAHKGIRSVGYELNPLLVLYSMVRCWPQRRLIQVKWGNFWQAPLHDADAIYIFLFDRFMPKLDKKITQEITKKVKVVSFAYKIPKRRIIKEHGSLYLYEYSPEQ